MLLIVLCALLGQSAGQCFSNNDGALNVSEKGRQELLQSQLHFSADLLRTVGNLQTADNVFFSPASVYNALLLAYFVSDKHTADSLREFLRLPQDQGKLDTYAAYSSEKYNHTMESIKHSLNYQLINANRMFVDRALKVRPCMVKHFRDEIEAVDLNKNASSTINKINSWVSTLTRENIKELLSPESLNANTNLVVVNAAYFRGFWKSKFPPKETRTSEFMLSNGTLIPVTMMSLENKFSYKMDENLEAEILELPYEGDSISMFIILPLNNSPSSITDLVNKTDAKTIQLIVDSLENTSIELSVVIPKFSIDQSLELTPVLESMGVGDLFRGSADLSALTGDQGPHFDTIIHRAKLTVDESGSEAAAATAIFANRFATDSLIANHPFIFFLFDKKSNTILFTGILNSPTT